MNGFAIIRLEASERGIVDEFNSYMQSKTRSRTPAFIDGSGAYFRLECSDSVPAGSVGIYEFGNFLQSGGYAISSISSGKTCEGLDGTQVGFCSNNGVAGHAVLSTLNVY